MKLPVDRVVCNLKRIGAGQLLGRIASKYGVSVDALLGDDHHHTPTEARRELWTVVKHTLDYSYSELACIVGRDRATLIEGVRKVERRLHEQYGVAS